LLDASGLLLAPLVAALPLALSGTAALAGRINPSETQITLPDAIKWSGWINANRCARRGEDATSEMPLRRPASVETFTHSGAVSISTVPRTAAALVVAVVPRGP
jgi:hypothetical protein